jgi:hypothetical protein
MLKILTTITVFAGSHSIRHASDMLASEHVTERRTCTCACACYGAMYLQVRMRMSQSDVLAGAHAHVTERHVDVPIGGADGRVLLDARAVRRAARRCRQVACPHTRAEVGERRP